MERAIQFGPYNTWINWQLMLTGKDFSPPEVKTNYVEIDGADGDIDMTEALAGRPTYRNRTFSAWSRFEG